ncbi:MAG: hypothetical protein JXA99_05650 [Candidatus Lokiarchaeota archaeon]|nr:hypothetical protein [Candidatus Lokiarchaeota archaeon]
MCNHCKCENEDVCSIKDSKPFGFCCVKCVHYSSQSICPFYPVEKQEHQVKFII